jgi:hypothetical protein
MRAAPQGPAQYLAAVGAMNRRNFLSLLESLLDKLLA